MGRLGRHRRTGAPQPRRRAEQRIDAHAHWHGSEESPHAAFSFHSKAYWKPLALCIRMGGFERHDRETRITGAFPRIAHWELAEQDVPWPMRETGLCPSPEAVWEWALGQIAPARQQAANHLGVSG